MRVFQLFKAADLFLKRMEQVEDSIAELKRMARQQDLDVSDAIEKIQRLAARLAKRAERLENNATTPGDGARADSGGLAKPDPISDRIRRQRAWGGPKLPTDE